MYAGLFIAYIGSCIYAKQHGASSAELIRATLSGVRKMWRVSVVLLFIGAVMSLWMVDGTIPALIQLATAVVHPNNVLWMSFVGSAVLSLVVGSAIATWSVLGPTFLAITPPHLVPWVAGAVLCGGMVGDRSSPMSTSALLVSTVCERTSTDTLRQLNRTLLLPFLVSMGVWMVVNHLLVGHSDVTRDGVSSFISGTSWWNFVPPIIVVLLAVCKVPLLYNFVIATLIAFGMGITNAHQGMVPLLMSAWNGTPFGEGHTVLHIGGVLHMLSAVLLILTAGAFQGVTELGGSVDYLVERIFAGIQGKGAFIASVFLVTLVFSLVMGSQMLSILMSANALKPQFEMRGLSKVSLTQVIGDAPELIPSIIPWNLLGFQATVILNTPPLVLSTHAIFIYLMLLFSLFMLWRACGSAAPRLKQSQVSHGTSSV
jgi:NhaC family Na+:H+ antiporter